MRRTDADRRWARGFRRSSAAGRAGAKSAVAAARYLVSGVECLVPSAFILMALLTSSSCTKGQLEGQSSAYAIVDSLSAASGAEPTKFSGALASDVLTNVKKSVNGASILIPTIFEDPGRVTLHLALKDPGTADKPTTPSPTNTITFTRYHVTYIRADGRNTPGVDVPYGFDGGLTVSVVGGNVSIGQLILVRGQAKDEAPLKALIGGGGAIVISTIAELTFYGTDQAGRAVSAVARINVDFADWGDPE
jgi:hypothetical protein